MKHFLRSRDQISKFGPGVNYKTEWKNLNNLLGRGGRQSEISKIIGNDGEIVTETIDIAESLNQFFMNIESSASTQQDVTYNPLNRVSNSIFLEPATFQEVTTIIMNLKNKKSVGWDSVSTLLAESFNQCILEGYYPKELKVARVVPVFKKGDPMLMDNYRPISILSIINKVFEKLIHKRLMNHLNRINFFYERQYGFRASSNTTGCAIDLMDYVYGEIDKLKVVTGTSWIYPKPLIWWSINCCY